MKKVFFLLLAIIFIFGTSLVYAENKIIKIGVLANRGPEQCLKQWSPTAKYLTEHIPAYSFVIVPLAYKEVISAVKNEEVNFILCNPSLYVELEISSSVYRISTLKKLGATGNYTLFGGVIFCRAGSNNIRDLKSLKGKKFMAVDETSFGGWLAVWRELKDVGINPYKDFKELKFSGNQDVVVNAVINGEVDAGAINTDVFETLITERKINLKDFYVINQHKEPTLTGEEPSFLYSTRLYPGWAFAKVKHTSIELAQKLAVTLLSMPEDSPPVKAAGSLWWAIPCNYQPVHDCLRELRIGPYKDYGKVKLIDIVQQYLWWVFTIFILLVFLSIGMVKVILLNHKIKLAETFKEGVVRMISHELKNPLAVIKESISLVLEGLVGDINSEQQKLLIIANNNMDRLIRITNDLLDVSKLESGIIELKKELINVADLVRQTVSFFGIRAKGKGIEIKTRLPLEAVNIYADKDKIYQVFNNLIGNAMKFTNNGFIEISVTEKEGNVECVVSDTGRGISEDNLSKVFKKFQQFGDRPKAGEKGTGLGLAIAKEIIELHKGKIYVESKLGEGTRFIFLLPKDLRKNNKL